MRSGIAITLVLAILSACDSSTSDEALQMGVAAQSSETSENVGDTSNLATSPDTEANSPDNSPDNSPENDPSMSDVSTADDSSTATSPGTEPNLTDVNPAMSEVSPVDDSGTTTSPDTEANLTDDDPGTTEAGTADSVNPAIGIWVGKTAFGDDVSSIPDNSTGHGIMVIDENEFIYSISETAHSSTWGNGTKAQAVFGPLGVL